MASAPKKLLFSATCFVPGLDQPALGVTGMKASLFRPIAPARLDLANAKRSKHEESSTPLSPSLPPKGSKIDVDRGALLRGETVYIDRAALRWGENNEDAIVVHRRGGWIPVPPVRQMLPAPVRKQLGKKTKRQSRDEQIRAWQLEEDLSIQEEDSGLFCREDLHDGALWPKYRKARC